MNYKSYKIEAIPNNCQVTNFNMSINVSRFSYNWGLSRNMESYKSGGKYLSFYTLQKEMRSLRKSEFKWMEGTCERASTNSLKNLDKAFKRFFKACKSKGSKYSGYPKYKSKKIAKRSFTVDGVIRVSSKKIRLPKIGWVKLKKSNYIPTDKKIISVTVSNKAGRWYVSVMIEEEIQNFHRLNNSVGIDLGINKLATLSNGGIIENPKYTKKYEKRLAKAQRILSRKKKGSKNRTKAKLKVQKLYQKISNSRLDVIHKATSKIINENQVIILEDLNVGGMIKNHKLAKSLQDASFGEFRRQLEYKSEWYGRELKFVPRFFPSSQLCSNCGSKKKLSLSERVYNCNTCSMSLDRDLNASININTFYTEGFSGINACGDVSSGSEILSETSVIEAGIQPQVLELV